jgi:hypothetical protein
MLEPVKELLRRHSLKKNASPEPTGFVPLDRIRSAVAFINVEDTSFNECKNILMLFFREHNIKADIFFFDFRKLTEGERLITSITTTILKKDLNWFGKPSKEKVNLMLAENRTCSSPCFPPPTIPSNSWPPVPAPISRSAASSSPGTSSTW